MSYNDDNVWLTLGSKNLKLTSSSNAVLAMAATTTTVYARLVDPFVPFLTHLQSSGRGDDSYGSSGRTGGGLGQDDTYGDSSMTGGRSTGGDNEYGKDNSRPEAGYPPTDFAITGMGSGRTGAQGSGGFGASDDTYGSSGRTGGDDSYGSSGRTGGDDSYGSSGRTGGSDNYGSSGRTGGGLGADDTVGDSSYTGGRSTGGDNEYGEQSSAIVSQHPSCPS
jgi:hypothetical protein